MTLTVLSAGDLGVEIDYGIENPPGTLQRLDNDVWQDYHLNGEAITTESLDIESLPPSRGNWGYYARGNTVGIQCAVICSGCL